jgi:hypothetical protein
VSNFGTLEDIHPREYSIFMSQTLSILTKGYQ